MGVERNDIIYRYLTPTIAKANLMDKNNLTLVNNIIQYLEDDDCVEPLRLFRQMGTDMTARDSTDLKFQPIHRAVHLGKKMAIHFLVNDIVKRIGPSLKILVAGVFLLENKFSQLA